MKITFNSGIIYLDNIIVIEKDSEMVYRGANLVQIINRFTNQNLSPEIDVATITEINMYRYGGVTVTKWFSPFNYINLIRFYNLFVENEYWQTRFGALNTTLSVLPTVKRILKYSAISDSTYTFLKDSYVEISVNLGGYFSGAAANASVLKATTTLDAIPTVIYYANDGKNPVLFSLNHYNQAWLNASIKFEFGNYQAGPIFSLLTSTFNVDIVVYS